ncbi:AAA family ATPase [Hyella patelloides]|uniref:ParA family protein n=1 Tax=Hyella patelloides TaxID=1982969 RepID=UPI00119EF73C
MKGDRPEANTLRSALVALPKDAPEAIVNNNFIVTPFFDALGFSLEERVPEFGTGKGHQKVDYALRHNTDENIFLNTQASPHVLVELKGRDIDLTYNSTSYKATVKQIKKYLLAPNCKSVQWGIITNSKHIQLFRKHGKTIYPATPCLDIKPDNIDELTDRIRKRIKNTPKALTIAVYNNKGGVGKTTTVINLAAVLTRHKKKVLIIDFDPNQQDLTNSLGIQAGKTSLYECLKDKKNSINLKNAIVPYTKKFKSKNNVITFSFDVLPVDLQLANIPEDKLKTELSTHSLRKKLETLKNDYDYILIDASPNWRFYSISAVYASDVVLIPTKHNNICSLENAAVTIKKYIPEIQKTRQEKTQGLEWGATALPIFFNGEKITDAARIKATNAIKKIIQQVKKESGLDLSPYLESKTGIKIFELPSNAYIGYAAFEKIPAAYKNKIAYSYYAELAKEYFLQ